MAEPRVEYGSVVFEGSPLRITLTDDGWACESHEIADVLAVLDEAFPLARGSALPGGGSSAVREAADYLGGRADLPPPRPTASGVLS